MLHTFRPSLFVRYLCPFQLNYNRVVQKYNTKKAKLFIWYICFHTFRPSLLVRYLCPFSFDQFPCEALVLGTSKICSRPKSFNVLRQNSVVFKCLSLSLTRRCGAKNNMYSCYTDLEPNHHENWSQNKSIL